MQELSLALLELSRYVLIISSVWLLIRCIRSLLSEETPREVWGWLEWEGDFLPLCHWENLLGRSKSCDTRLKAPGVQKIQAVLTRSDRGRWTLHKVFSGELWVNGQQVGAKGLTVKHGDILHIGSAALIFHDLSTGARQRLEAERPSAGHSVSPFFSGVLLSIFVLGLMLQHLLSAEGKYMLPIVASFGILLCLHWGCYTAMRLMGRQGFEAEVLGFYLSALGMSVAASSTPEDMLRQSLLLMASVLLFLLLGWWLRSLKRSTALRLPFALLALGLLALNVATADAVFGARNWLEIGGFSFQPSEFVKVAYVYVGASTLDRLYRGRNLLFFLIFSAVCVMALALIGDFGTALIFFTCFLLISFMRSGSIATVVLAISGAVMAGFLAVSVRPYIASRFAVWGHVWEDVYDKGFQQTRAMSAAASGGFTGKGAGQGWLQDVVAANTDMVFALVCEEQGLVVGLCMVASLLVLALFALRSVQSGRSAYYGIAACATMCILLTQLSLNVFGSLDILPFTGVTFPFVSRGGSSLLSCWMLLAFLKAADNRREGSFAVKRVRKLRNKLEDDYAGDQEEEEQSDEPEAENADPETEIDYFRFDPDAEDDAVYLDEDWEEYKP